MKNSFKRSGIETSAKCIKSVRGKSHGRASWSVNKRRLKKRRLKRRRRSATWPRGRLKFRGNVRPNSIRRTKKRRSKLELQRSKGSRRPKRGKRNKKGNRKSFKDRPKPFWRPNKERLTGRSMKWR